MIVADDVKIREVKTFNGSDCWFAMAKTPKAMFSRSNKENEHRAVENEYIPFSSMPPSTNPIILARTLLLLLHHFQVPPVRI
jgi:hypothetical protein